MERDCHTPLATGRYRGTARVGHSGELVPDGIGDIHVIKGAITYSGGIKLGKKHGEGELRVADKISCSGNFEDDFRHGTATTTHRRGSAFSGEYQHGIRHGDGKNYQPHGHINQGSYANGTLSGHGQAEFPDGSRYEGAFRNGLRHGRGTSVWPDGEVYKGHYVTDRRHGVGEYTWTDGSCYRGDFVHGQRHGNGTFTWPSGDRFVGKYKHDLRDGFGRLLYADSGAVDEGIWRGARLVVLSSAISGWDERGRAPILGPLAQTTWDLFNAAKESNIEAMNAALATGLIDIDTQDSRGLSALRISCDNCQEAAASHLVQRGANLDVLAEDGSSALFSAYQKCHTNPSFRKIVASLLDHGASPNCTTTDQSVLGLAAASGDIEMVKHFVDSGGDVNYQMCDGSSVLLLAAQSLSRSSASESDGRHQFCDIVRLLVQAGADINACTSSGKSPLHCLMAADNHEARNLVTELIARNGTQLDLVWKGSTPLSLAVASGQDDLVKHFVSAGCNLNTSLGNNSLLTMALDDSVRDGEARLALLNQLLDSGADILAPVAINDGEPGVTGTVFDYAYKRFILDSKLHKTNLSTISLRDKAQLMQEKDILKCLLLKLRAANRKNIEAGKPGTPFCEECGRSVGVKLKQCRRCQRVYFCSERCKLRAMSSHHRRTCVSVTGDYTKVPEVPGLKWDPNGHPIGRPGTCPPRLGRTHTGTGSEELYALNLNARSKVSQTPMSRKAAVDLPTVDMVRKMSQASQRPVSAIKLRTPASYLDRNRRPNTATVSKTKSYGMSSLQPR